MVKRKFVFLLIIFLFTGFFSWAQEKLTWEVSPNPVGINDNFNLVIFVNHPESRDIEVPKQDYPDGIQLWRGPYVRPVTVKTKEGVNKRVTRITFTFRARRSGRIIFDPVKILLNDEALSTPVFILEVGNYISRKLVIPLEVSWSAPEDFIYVGEAVPLLLEVENQKEITLFDSVAITPPSTGIFQEYEGIGEISWSDTGGIRLYTIPAAFAIFTPVSASRISIPSAEISAGTSSGTSSRLLLDTAPVPEEIAPTGAIGRFEITGRMEHEEIHRMDEIRFYLRVDGTGNLNYLQIPVPEFQGAEVLSSFETEKYIPTLAGYKGYRELVFTLKIEDVPQLAVEVPPFPYMERPSGKIIPSLKKTITYDLLPALPQEETVENEKALPPLLMESTDIPDFFDFNKNRYLFLFFIPGPAAFLIFRLVTAKSCQAGSLTALLLVFALPGLLLISGDKDGYRGAPVEKSTAEWKLCSDFYTEGSFSRALAVIENNSSMSGDEGWIYYNRGLIFAGLKDWDRAIYEMAKAVRLEPQNRLFREEFKLFTELGDVENSSPLQLQADIRYLIVVCIILVNLLSLMGIFYRMKSGGLLSILMILATLLILVSIVLFSLSLLSSSADRGVVFGYQQNVQTEAGEGAPGLYLKKIPRDEGEDWFPVREGTVVRILDRAGNYVLVENGEDIRGWMHLSGIRSLEDK